MSMQANNSIFTVSYPPKVLVYLAAACLAMAAGFLPVTGWPAETRKGETTPGTI